MTSPQFARHTHRAREHLITAGRLYPNAWHLADSYRAGRGTLYPSWPDWCFLPVGAAAGIVASDADIPIGQLVLRYPERILDAARIAALATWRMTQGIYRIDPALYAALTDTPVSGDLPADVLSHLPEWCVYIETPDRTYAGERLHGFWAHLEYDQSGRSELRLLLDGEPPVAPLLPIAIHLSGGLEQGINAVLTESRHQAMAHGLMRPNDGPAEGETALGAALRADLEPLVSLLLYLCTEAADVSRRGRYEDRPANPTSVRTRRHGWRLFATDGPREWDVGVRIGAALRAAYQREQTGGAAAPSGRHVRPHVRRAHWHTFVSGPRADAMQQVRDLRWLPPIPINVESLDALPATIKPVAGNPSRGAA